MARAVADGAVNPPIHAPTKIVDDRVGVGGAEPGVKGLDPVRHAVTVRVATAEDVRRLRDDHAVPVEYKGGHQLQPAGHALLEVGEHALLVPDTIAVSGLGP